MGWTTTHKNSGESVKSFFEKRWNRIDEKSSFKVLDCKVKARTAYLACETIAEGKRDVFAYVCLLHYRPKDAYNFGYKDMDESVGPYDTHCPAAILDLLTPTTNEYALEWREKCRKNLEYAGQRKLTKHSFDKILKPGCKIFLQKCSIPSVIFSYKSGKSYHGSGYRFSSKFIDFEKTIKELSV
jgi:hypothetical protein